MNRDTETEQDLISQIRQAAERKVLFLPHALRQMLSPHRMITRAEVRQVIALGEIIEDYPDDPSVTLS